MEEKLPKSLFTVSQLIIKGEYEFATRDYRRAIIFFSEAIDICSDDSDLVTCLLKRSKCYMAIKDIEKAQQDVEKLMATESPDKPSEAYGIAIDCHIAMGQIYEAESVIEKVTSDADAIDIVTKERQDKLRALKNLYDDINDSLDAKFFRKSLKFVEKALKIAPLSDDFKFLKMRCLVILKQFYDARHMREKIDGDESGKINKLCYKALKSYYEGDVDESLKYLRDAQNQTRKNIKAIEYIRHRILRFNERLLVGE